jgi:hypothetical protein
MYSAGIRRDSTDYERLEVSEKRKKETWKKHGRKITRISKKEPMTWAASHVQTGINQIKG